jgi:hypothetical protein
MPGIQAWTRRRLLAGAVALASVALLAPAAPAMAEAPAAGQRAVLVELFTSQGCSSCPPADAYLGELARRDDIVALSFHVDYWDYIGWTDPFATEATTRRQRVYARRLGQAYVYTPEMVVGGRVHSAYRREVSGQIENVAEQATQVPVALTRRGDGSVTIALPQTEIAQPCEIWIAGYDAEHRTAVKRGENSGRELVNYNVVRHIERLERWDGAAREIVLSPEQVTDAGDGLAVIVQGEDQGSVVGAAKLALN